MDQLHLPNLRISDNSAELTPTGLSKSALVAAVRGNITVSCRGHYDELGAYLLGEKCREQATGLLFGGGGGRQCLD